MPTPSTVEPDWTKQNVVKVNGQWTVDGRPSNKVALSWHESPPNIPGKAYIGLTVTAPINATSPPHRHGGAAVSATVIKGRVLNQMVCPDGHVVGPQIYEVGESWYEPPGCHHVQSENAGEEEAMFVAGFVVDQESMREKEIVKVLTQFDADIEEEEEEEEERIK